MKIAFVTTQTLRGSTVIGRVMPLAKEFAAKHDVHVLVHRTGHDEETKQADPKLRYIGKDPFQRTARGKKRKKGLALITQMLGNSMKTLLSLYRLKPDVVIIIKPLPQNVLAVKIWSVFNRNKTVILDVDDFELTANVLTSIIQRAAIHWAERTGASMSKTIVTASPFLKDHFEQLVNYKKPVIMIPTGLTLVNSDINDSSFFSLAYIGSISESSGHCVGLLPDIMLLVKQHFHGIKLHMFGDGDDTVKLQNKFKNKKLADNVVWHGRFNTDEINQHLNRKIILIDPVDISINNRAKSSYRAALACALGLPVVSSNIGIRPYLIPDELHDYFFAEPRNADSYAGKIIHLLNYPLSDKDRSLLREYSSKNTWQYLANKYDTLITR